MEDPLVPAAGLPPPPTDDGASVANAEIFLAYLRKTITVVLGPGPLGITSANIFEDKVSVEVARKFISDPQTRVILVQKLPRKGSWERLF
jgi:hypothetical protein